MGYYENNIVQVQCHVINIGTMSEDSPCMSCGYVSSTPENYKNMTFRILVNRRQLYERERGK
jgi:hypothetical protein